MSVATHVGKVRLCVYIQLTLERRPFRFFTMLNNGSCMVITYWLAVSVFVFVVDGYVLRACVAAPECFVLMVNMKKFVAHVAVVAIVIERNKGMRATFSLPFVKSSSIIRSKESSNKRDDTFFTTMASAKYNTYIVYNTSNTCIDCLKRDKVNTPCTCCEHIVAGVQSQKD